MHRIFPTLLLFLLLLAGVLPGFSQETHGAFAADTVADIPVLDRFHEVIFVIWHDAWPKKDTGKLIALLPDVKAGVDSIGAAKLPGFLREKKAAWEHGVSELKGAAEQYGRAANGRDSAGLLKAAELLHARYEALVRILRPIMKEIEGFHATLYVLYHSYLPEYSLANITRAAGELKSKMAILEKAPLPERHKNKSDAFNAARKELAAAVASLTTIVLTGDEPKVRAAVETVHTAYESLTHVFEP